MWQTRPVGQPVEGADGGIYRECEIIPDDNYHSRNPFKRPPLRVWERLSEGYRVERDTSPDRPPIKNPYKSKGKDIRELQGKHVGPVAILGNGFSLSQVDLHKIPCPQIGMNRTFKGYKGFDGPMPDYYVLIDSPWLSKPEVREHPFVINCSTNTDGIGYQVVKSHRMSPFSYDLWRDGLVPVNTGYAAIQVAVYLGFSELYLFGFDFMKDVEQRDYKPKENPHFDGTPSGTGMFRQAHFFRQAAESLKQHGIKAFFVGSPENGTDCLPHITFGDFLARTT